MFHHSQFTTAKWNNKGLSLHVSPPLSSALTSVCVCVCVCVLGSWVCGCICVCVCVCAEFLGLWLYLRSYFRGRWGDIFEWCHFALRGLPMLFVVPSCLAGRDCVDRCQVFFPDSNMPSLNGQGPGRLALVAETLPTLFYKADGRQHRRQQPGKPTGHHAELYINPIGSQSHGSVYVCVCVCVCMRVFACLCV